jgi:hypothetical protein
MIRSSQIFLILLLWCANAQAQLPENTTAKIEAQAVLTTDHTVPFWMRSNQYGSIPLSGASTSFLLGIKREYDFLPVNQYNTSSKLFDWGYGFEGRANLGDKSNLQIIEANIKARLSIFQLKLGRSKDVMGFVGDTVLSSGSFAESGNALGVPKIELSIPNYWTLPIFDGLFAIKGTFSHGWINKFTPNFPFVAEDDIEKLDSYLHQKSFYARLGKESWKLKLYGGFNHQGTWGDERKYYGSLYTLSKFQTFLYVIQGKTFNSPGIPGSKMGNQLGSIDVAGEYDLPNLNIKLYRQFFYDIGGLSRLANVSDGLNGITLTNKRFEDEDNQIFSWNKLLFEFFYSFHQGGVAGSKYTRSGPEDYYNNYFYKEGWSYKGEGLGNPLITSKKYAKPGQAESSYANFINNRVIAYHIAANGKIADILVGFKATYSDNYGTFNTSAYRKTLGGVYVTSTENLFKNVKQYSLLAEANKEIRSNTWVGMTIGTDVGDLLPNSFGILLKLRKEIR